MDAVGPKPFGVQNFTSKVFMQLETALLIDFDGKVYAPDGNLVGGVTSWSQELIGGGGTLTRMDVVITRRLTPKMMEDQTGKPFTRQELLDLLQRTI